MSAVAPLTDHYVETFGARGAALPGEDHAWLRSIREAGIERFATLGFPATSNEQWKYTNVKALTRHRFVPAASAAALDAGNLGERALTGLDAHTLVFVDGLFAPALSAAGALPPGVRLLPFAAAVQQLPELLERHLARYADGAANGFAALNEAFMRDGAVLELSAGARLEKPVHLLFVASAHEQPTWQPLRNLVVAGPGSEAVIIETHTSLDAEVYFTNAVSELVLGEGARIEHYKLQAEGPQAYHVATVQVSQGRDSRFVSHSMATGARLARTDLNVSLDAEGAECSLYGLYVTGGRQHIDNHTRVDHRKPHGTSREFYKGVLGGRSRAVFNGQVYVHPHAQHTDAQQSNNNLLLSADAEIDTKPQLEIYADDVKCAHGATVGQLDEHMLYYMRSRGIEERRARAMLTYGFAHDLIENMPLAPIREAIEHLLMARLPDAEYLGDVA